MPSSSTTRSCRCSRLAPAFELSVDVLPAIRDARRDLRHAGRALRRGRAHRPRRERRPRTSWCGCTGRRASTGPLPCVYSIHGGGYVLGTYDDGRRRASTACARSFPCVGVSVEYRLAPETAYPGPLDDCYAGLRWTLRARRRARASTPTASASPGVSAGGGLAAALALLARDRGEVPVAFQLLECPMIDDRQTTSSSQLDGLPIWSRESNEFGWRSYLGDLYGRDDVPPYAAPARADDLSGLPPALVIVGGADGFRDEDIELRAAARTRPACRPSCTCSRARRTACRCSRTRWWPGDGTGSWWSGSGSNSRAS